MLTEQSGDQDLSQEVDHTSRSVGQLGALLCDMEVIRDTLEYENDINYFDKRVNPAKEEVHHAVMKLKGRQNKL